MRWEQGLRGQEPGSQLPTPEPGEGMLAGEQLEEQEAGGPDVRAGIGDFAAPLLRGHVRRRTAHGEGARRHSHHRPREAEVEELRPAIAQHEDVARLEVAVDEAPLVRVREPLGNVGHQVQRAPQVGPLPPQQGPQGFALQVLHDEEGHPRRRPFASLGKAGVPLGHVVDAEDVFMVQPGHGPRLLAQACQQLGAGLGPARREELQGDGALEFPVQRTEDVSHASLPEQPDDLVPVPLLASQPLSGDGQEEPRLRPGDFSQEAVIELRAVRPGLHARRPGGPLHRIPPSVRPRSCLPRPHTSPQEMESPEVGM